MKPINLIISTIFITGFLSCNQNNTAKNQTPTDSLVIEKKDSLINENSKCFLAFVGKDSAFLSLQIKQEKVQGYLNYQFFEKDNNKGTIEGLLTNDTLNLIYTFSSEGNISTRPVKMLVKKNQIFEIYGDEIATEGKGFIYNPSGCKE